MAINQLGRRNVSPEQRAYLIGKIYRETKKEAPNPTGKNQYTEVGANNLPQPKTAERIAEQFNVSGRTGRRRKSAQIHSFRMPR